MRPSHALIIGSLTLVALLGIVVLAALGRGIPDVLPAVGLSGLAALAGLAVPQQVTAAPAAAPAPAYPPYVPPAAA